jgi:hypothetical protein
MMAAAIPAAVLQAETVWSRWSGAWEVTLDRQPDGATCLWSTYDAPPPDHVRRLIFTVNRRGEVVVILSDRGAPIHRLDPRPGALLTLGGRLYVIEIGAGIPLPDLPGGMLVGRVRGEGAVPFTRNFGQRRDDEHGQVILPSGSTWRLSLQGATAAAKDIQVCMAEAGVESSPR